MMPADNHPPGAGDDQAAGGARGETRHPMAVFLADPDSHLADILYLYFRVYKRELIWRLFSKGIERICLRDDDTLNIADVGASMGFDFKYILHRLTGGWSRSPPWKSTFVTLLEGNPETIEEGKREWAPISGRAGIGYRYIQADLVQPLPLPDESQHVVLCSEVVEHLVDPRRMFREIHRVLAPGGAFILTTDNSPSLPQRVKRIPSWIMGKYKTRYARPDREKETVQKVVIDDQVIPIYGHINLNPTRFWEAIGRDAGFSIASFGTYESVRRGGGRKTPGGLAFYFTLGFLVSLLPTRLGRFFGDSTAVLFRKTDVRRRSSPSSA